MNAAFEDIGGQFYGHWVDGQRDPHHTRCGLEVSDDWFQYASSDSDDGDIHCARCRGRGVARVLRFVRRVRR